jgi:hypothetical protein
MESCWPDGIGKAAIPNLRQWNWSVPLKGFYKWELNESVNTTCIGEHLIIP